MDFYYFRKMIRKLPGVVIKAVPKPAPRIMEGFGARREAGTICAEKGLHSCLLVTDTTLFRLGYHKKIAESLEEAGIRYQIFSDISSEPTVDIIDRGCAAAASCQAEAIIALGGGSVLDSCKIIAAGTKMKRRSTRALLLKFRPVPGKTIPMISVPSTAGTGAEITVGAVVTSRSLPKRSPRSSSLSLTAGTTWRICAWSSV